MGQEAGEESQEKSQGGSDDEEDLTEEDEVSLINCLIRIIWY